MSDFGLLINQLAFWIAVCYLSVAMVWFWSRRKVFPIAQRKPYIVLAEMGSFLMVTVVSLLPRAFQIWDFRCLVIRLMSSFFFYPTVALTTLRVFLLWYWQIITAAGVKHYDSNFNNSDKSLLLTEKQNKLSNIETMLLKKRSVLTDNFWLTIAVSFGMVFFLSTLQFAVRNPETSEVSTKTRLCEEYRSSNGVISSIATVLMCFLPIGFLLWKIRHSEDHLYLKEEFKSLVIICVVFSICNIASVIFSNLFIELDIVFVVTTFVPSITFTTLTLYRVIHWSYVHQEILQRNHLTSTESTNSALLDLKSSRVRVQSQSQVRNNFARQFVDFLEDKEGHQLFFRHVQKEFSPEGIMMYDACKKYRMNYDSWAQAEPNRIQSLGRQIYTEFIRNDAPLMVNISYKCRMKLCAKFEQKDLTWNTITVTEISSVSGDDQKSLSTADGPSKERTGLNFSLDLFAEAETEIILLIASDSFRRFKLSREYKAWEVKNQL